jgi:hypothetical protein
MPRPSNSSPFDHPNNIWWGVQIIMLPSYTLHHSIFTSSFSRPNIFLSTLFSNIRSLFYSFAVAEKLSNYSLVHIKLYIFGSRNGISKILHRIVACIPWVESNIEIVLGC